MWILTKMWFLRYEDWDLGLRKICGFLPQTQSYITVNLLGIRKRRYRAQWRTWSWVSNPAVPCFADQNHRPRPAGDRGLAGSDRPWWTSSFRGWGYASRCDAPRKAITGRKRQLWCGFYAIAGKPLIVLAFNVPLSPQDGWPGSADRLWSQLGPWHCEGPGSCQSWTPGWALMRLKLESENSDPESLYFEQAENTF